MTVTTRERDELPMPERALTVSPLPASAAFATVHRTGVAMPTVISPGNTGGLPIMARLADRRSGDVLARAVNGLVCGCIAALRPVHRDHKHVLDAVGGLFVADPWVYPALLRQISMSGGRLPLLSSSERSHAVWL